MISTLGCDIGLNSIRGLGEGVAFACVVANRAAVAALEAARKFRRSIGIQSVLFNGAKLKHTGMFVKRTNPDAPISDRALMVLQIQRSRLGSFKAF